MCYAVRLIKPKFLTMTPKQRNCEPSVVFVSTEYCIREILNLFPSIIFHQSFRMPHLFYLGECRAITCSNDEVYRWLEGSRLLGRIVHCKRISQSQCVHSLRCHQLCLFSNYVLSSRIAPYLLPACFSNMTPCALIFVQGILYTTLVCDSIVGWNFGVGNCGCRVINGLFTTVTLCF